MVRRQQVKDHVSAQTISHCTCSGVNSETTLMCMLGFLFPQWWPGGRIGAMEGIVADAGWQVGLVGRCIVADARQLCMQRLPGLGIKAVHRDLKANLVRVFDVPPGLHNLGVDRLSAGLCFVRARQRQAPFLTLVSRSSTNVLTRPDRFQKPVFDSTASVKESNLASKGIHANLSGLCVLGQHRTITSIIPHRCQSSGAREL